MANPVAGPSLPPEPTMERRERLRFDDFNYEVFANGQCLATLSLELQGDRYQGASEGTHTLEGRLRVGALAAVQAAEAATANRIELELLGVKAVRAFDQWIVIVSIRGRSGDHSYRLLGSFATDEADAARGAAMAVLDATNRILEKYLN